MASEGGSPNVEASEGVVLKPKALSSSPALSCISTVALSEVEVLEFSDDEDCDANDEPLEADAFQWCLVGSRIAPVFAAVLHKDILEDSPVHKLHSEETIQASVTDDQEQARWRQVGLRLAAVMKEAAEQEDAYEERDSCSHSEPLHADAGADEHSWRLVGLRLANLFSSLDYDGEIALPTSDAGEYPKEAHERWHTVGSRLSAVLQTAKQ